MKKIFLWILLMGMYGTQNIYALTCDDIKRQHGRLFLETRKATYRLNDIKSAPEINILILEKKELQQEALFAIFNGCNLTLSRDAEKQVFHKNATLNQRKVQIMKANIQAYKKRKKSRFGNYEFREEIAHESYQIIDELEENFKKQEAQNKSK